MPVAEEDWSAKRKEKDELEEKAAQERAREGLQGVNALLKKFSEDEYFKDDLKQPQVVMALKHWTGEKRLPPEQATRLFAEDYRCRAVLEKLRVLQAECQKAGIAVPLDQLMRGEKELKLPGSKKTSAAGGGVKTKNTTAPTKKPSPTAKEASKEGPTSDAKPPRRRTVSKASSGGADKTETVGSLSKAPGVVSLVASLLIVLLGVLFAWYAASPA